MEFLSQPHLEKLVSEGYQFSEDGFAWKGDVCVMLFESVRIDPTVIYERLNRELLIPAWHTPTDYQLQGIVRKHF